MLGDKFNLMGLLKNAGKIQGMVEGAQSELEKIEVTGEAGAGAVTATINAR
ncbi:MAG: YbaB/EbfC family nucleoid-associated protein, partial [Gammaproteobacteria bacterium]|nr:YbaB/EbfC family nucleoid-associated protein [Gammaproteobacteria bacterium]